MSAAARQRSPEERAKAAERARRWRERHKAGLRPLLINVPDHFGLALVDRHVLTEYEAEDVRTLAVEAARIIERWMQDE
jgi:hypothetical protein